MAAQTPPPQPLLQSGVADAIEGRIKLYLERRGVSLDPVYDGLTNLFNWYDKDRKTIEDNYQTVADQARHFAQEVNRKDLHISQLRSERDALGQHVEKIEAKRKSDKEACQDALDAIEQLKRDNQSIALERDGNIATINSLRDENQGLKGAIHDIKTTSANNLQAMQRKYEAQLQSERQQISTMVAQHREDLAEKDREANLAAQQHREELDNRVGQWRTALQQSNAQMEAQARQHRGEMEKVDLRIAQIVEKHDVEVKSREERMAAMENHYQQRLAEVESSVQAEIDRAQKEDRVTIGKQRQQIASYTKDSYVPIDDALFTKSFQALVQDVNQLASQIRLPPTIDFDPSLDPTGCLERNSGLRSWIWPRFVRNLCWQVLLSGFCSLPFGFGAFGDQGDGYEELRRMYQATARLTLTEDMDPVTAMPNEKDVNLYRALYMEKILSAIRSEGATGGEMAYAVVFQKNVDAVARRLYDTLHHIVDGQVGRANFQQAFAVAHKLGILVLEMGTQRARVWLQTCHYGEHSTPDGWKTEETASIGSGVMVDLMVHPCLSRLGDGRGDLTKKKVMAKGEFVPLR
jgi:hypothetical protein